MIASKVTRQGIHRPLIAGTSRTGHVALWHQKRANSASRAPVVNVDELLKEPTWNVESLLPKAESHDEDSKHISSKQLHHLLRLSALPPPKDAEEESKLLSTLASQLHFVREIQKVDTTNVEPLQSLRDETASGREDATINLEQLKEAFTQEDLKGDYYKRIRRRQHDTETKNEAEEWDVLGHAQKKVGRYFVVEGGKED
ncbi:hypothetical protein MBLNU457_3208t1 [Dothideomycetes sp. NU457]